MLVRMKNNKAVLTSAHKLSFVQLLQFLTVNFVFSQPYKFCQTA